MQEYGTNTEYCRGLDVSSEPNSRRRGDDAEKSITNIACATAHYFEPPSLPPPVLSFKRCQPLGSLWQLKVIVSNLFVFGMRAVE